MMMAQLERPAMVDVSKDPKNSSEPSAKEAEKK